MKKHPKPSLPKTPNWILANLYWVGVIACSATILSLNTLPASSLPSQSFFRNVPHFDKFVHFHMYFGLMFLVWNAMIFTLENLGKTKLVMPVLLFPFCFAILDELLQYPVPGRMTDPLDLLADWCGAGFILFLGYSKSQLAKRTGHRR